MRKSERSAFDAPLSLYETEVKPEWVDYNGHMSEAYYVLIFGYATDALLDLIGMDADYRERSGLSLYTLEAHVSYLQEVREHESVRITTQLLDLDYRRAHIFHAMYHDSKDTLLATEEIMLMCVDTVKAASAPFPEEVASRLWSAKETHDYLPTPKQAGRPIALRR